MIAGVDHFPLSTTLLIVFNVDHGVFSCVHLPQTPTDP